MTPSAVVVSVTPNLVPCVIFAFFPLIVNNFGLDNVLESPSFSRASISTFNCLDPTFLIIPNPEVPSTKKLETLFPAVPNATPSVPPIIPES